MDKIGDGTVIMIGLAPARTLIAVGPGDVERFAARGWGRLDALSVEQLREALVDAYDYIDAFERGDLDDG